MRKTERERIAEKLFEGVKEAEKFCDDQSYIFYIGFSVMGSALIDQLGFKKFKEIVKEIEKRANIPKSEYYTSQNANDDDSPKGLP